MIKDTLSENDSEVIHRVVRGEVNAFEILMNRYQEQVLRIVKKRVPYGRIEEMAQEVFIRAYQGLPAIRQKENFRHWISSIAVRTCYDFWRKEYRQREIPISDLTDDHGKWLEDVSAEKSPSHDQNLRRKEAAELLDWALARLSAAERSVFELVYLEGLSGKEAASLLGWSVANVKVRSYRCRKKMKKLLSELLQEKQ
jgi:RNA polymerase sigma-70 factor (ECF subfamily)